MSDIFTIGYANRNIDDFVRLLSIYKIEYVIDVRSQPYSKAFPDFSQKPLQVTLEQHNLRYVFMGDALGGRPGDPDCYTEDGKVDYEICKTKQFYLDGIERLKSAHNQGLTVVLVCSELKPEECHRSKLIGASLQEEGIPVFHIDESGKLKSQQVVMNELFAKLSGTHPAQLKLFADMDNERPRLTSRKSYRSPSDSQEPSDET